MIRVARPAQTDLRRITAWIKQEGGTARAGQVSASIIASFRRLEQFPLVGRPGRIEGTRELVVPGIPYIVIYVLVPTGVEIARIMHGAQQWPPPDST